jgi:cytochrome c
VRASIARVGASAFLGLAIAGCGPGRDAAGADAANGKLLLRQFGCGSCHRIPGVVAAEGRTGPPLAGVAKRVYLAGVLPNSAGNMARWIRAPRDLKPGTTMPDLGVTESQARDMVAYLRELR